MRRLLVGVGALVVMVGAGGAPATAEVYSGSCTASIAGVDVTDRSASDPGDAVDVGTADTVDVSATSAAPVEGYKVQLEYAGITWTVAKGEADDETWTRPVNVGDYSRYGVGLYKVHGISRGPGACAGAALVKVGGNPLATAAGLGGLALGAMGLVGVASGARGGLKGGRGLDGDRLARTRAGDLSVLSEVRTPAQYVEAMESLAATNPALVNQVGPGHLASVKGIG